MQKKASCLLLTGALILLAALPGARAAEVDPLIPAPTNSQVVTASPAPSPVPTVVIPDAPNALPDGNTVTFEGHIAPQIVSAIIPCNISFHMDPNGDASVEAGDGETIPLSEVINPDTAIVQNNSIWPVRVSVTKVETPAAQGAAPITLVNTMNPGDGEVLLVLGEKDEAIPTGVGGSPPVFESEADFLGQALLAAQDAQSPLPILDVGANESKNLWVYGKATPAEQEYSFTVTVTLRIDWMRGPAPPP